MSLVRWPEEIGEQTQFAGALPAPEAMRFGRGERFSGPSGANGERNKGEARSVTLKEAVGLCMEAQGDQQSPRLKGVASPAGFPSGINEMLNR